MYSRDLIAAVKRYCSLNSVSSRHVGIIFGVNKDTVIRWLSDIQPSKHVREKVHVRIASSVRQILLTNPFFRLLDVQHALANLSIDASITSIFRSIQYLRMSYKCTQRDDGKTATRPHSFYKQIISDKTRLRLMKRALHQRYSA
jgi:hypothetical protein